MNYNNPKLQLPAAFDGSGSVAWQSPSNIALIKYWGKYGNQLPRNPSLSFTLNNAHTNTQVTYSPKAKDQQGLSIEFWFEGKENAAFQLRIERFLNSLSEIFPFLTSLHLKIESNNSFPHSAGIASSASAMSAMALCLCSIEHELFHTLEDPAVFYQKASHISRLGSGSACRSVYQTVTIWGENKYVKEGSNEYAIPYYEKINPGFHTFKDAILIASRKEKSVSSSAGHQLMENNIYADTRFQQANDNLGDLLTAMEKRDMEQFGKIVENEALSLHALMMTSDPPYILMNTNTLQILNKIWDFRNSTNLPVFFTLDAGPNVHLLYPENISNEVETFIKAELTAHCEDKQWIADEVGQGPKMLLNGI